MNERSWDEHKEQVEAFFEQPDPVLKGKLDEALYSMSELGLWLDDVDSMSVEQALRVWKVVEKLRSTEFPPDLRM